MSMTDVILSEVRKHRDEHSKKFNYSLKAIVADYKKNHEKFVEKLRSMKENTVSESSEDNSVSSTKAV